MVCEFGYFRVGKHESLEVSAGDEIVREFFVVVLVVDAVVVLSLVAKLCRGCGDGCVVGAFSVVEDGDEVGFPAGVQD